MRIARIVVVFALLAMPAVQAGPLSDARPIVPASSRAPLDSQPLQPSAPPTDPAARERSEADQPDGLPDGAPCLCTHLIYFRPSDRPDQRLDTNGTIDASIRSLRAWFANSIGRQPRIDRLAGTAQFDITHVLGGRTAAQYTTLSSIIEDLRARGLNEPSKRYVIYAAIDRGTTCGEATYPYPGLTTTTYAAIYLDSLPCSARDFGNGTLGGAGIAETIATHEWLHAEGVVPVTAPRHCTTSPYHLCTGPLWLVPTSVTTPLDPEQSDVMYPLIDARLSKKVLDRNRDDYLDHGLATHANLRDSAFLEAG